MKLHYLFTRVVVATTLNGLLRVAMARTAVFALASFALVPTTLAQEAARWFQVEISIFSYTNFDTDAERWEAIRQAPTLLPSARQLIRMSDELALSSWSAEEATGGPLTVQAQNFQTQNDLPLAAPVQPGPAPFRAENSFRLPDIARDAFVVLPNSEHDFLDTNRTLERSPSHRLLFHAAWRQPVRQSARSTAIMVSGGNNDGANHEMEGSVRFRFNPNEDRVVIDARIWIEDPAADATVEYPFIQLIQSRDMRSNEFHYLDHPSLGIVVQVKPYTVPPLETASGLNDATTVTTPPTQ